MNWKKKLAQKLGYRNQAEEICKEKYNNLLKEVIKPTLADIKNELGKYVIISDIEECELKVEYASSGYWFKFKIEKSEYCIVKFTAFYIDKNDPDLEPGVQPKLIDGYKKEVEIDLINPDLIGDIFYEAFTPFLDNYYRPGK